MRLLPERRAYLALLERKLSNGFIGLMNAKLCRSSAYNQYVAITLHEKILNRVCSWADNCPLVHRVCLP